MNEDIAWKIKEAVARIKERYHFIGHQTGAPFLAIVFPAGCRNVDHERMASPSRHLR